MTPAGAPEPAARPGAVAASAPTRIQRGFALVCALIAENHVYDVLRGIGVYLDEGSRYVTVRDNVFDGLGLWLNLNALGGAHPRRTAADNVARGNWHNAGKANGSWSDYANNRLVDNITIDGQDWPEGARKVIARAGPAPDTKPSTTNPQGGE